MVWAAGVPVKLSMCCRPGPPVQLPQGLSHAFASVEKVQMGVVALIAVGAWALPPSYEPVPAPPVIKGRIPAFRQTSDNRSYQ